MRLHPDDIKAIAREVVKAIAPLLPQTNSSISITDQMHIREWAKQAMNRPRREKKTRKPKE